MTSDVSVGAAIDFDPFAVSFFDDPHAVYRRLRAEAPVYHNEKYGFWALSRYQDVAAGMKDFGTYSSAKGITLDMFLDPEPRTVSVPLIIMMDPPDHTRMRKLVNKVFTPRAVTALEAMVRHTIREAADKVDPVAFDIVADFAALFPVEVITTMLGVPAADRQQLRLWTDAGLHREAGHLGPTQAGVEAARSSARYYYDLVTERRAQPRDDMISRLTRVELDHGDGTTNMLTDLEIVGFCSLLGGAGAETVTKLVGSAAVTFADHPDQWQELRADRSKIPAAIEELLRYDGPVQYDIRYSLRDVHLHGHTIPEGSPVMMLLASATRDESAFPDAGRFDVNRPHTGHNLAFGYGIHSCLGAALARMESRIALDVLLDMMPRYEVDRPGLRRVAMSNVAGWSNVPIRVPR
ncbi:cytochrome P450 [Mycolicibacterium septicum]|uniref:cytochrome P450 n=1 Tax=Mycolicibacterium septicum TaxID=98668 RepID=UPI0023627C90|nr:cytochrome P450 [Mycolicibacterium septicum]